MTQRTERPSMPLPLKLTLGILGFQVFANAAAGVLLVVAAAEDIEHGRDVPALQYILGYGSVVVAAVLLVCIVLLIRRVPAVRPVVACLEVLTALSGLIALVQGAPQGVVGMVLSLLVLMHLFRADVTTWLAGSPPAMDNADPAVR